MKITKVTNNFEEIKAGIEAENKGEDLPAENKTNEIWILLYHHAEATNSPGYIKPRAFFNQKIAEENYKMTADNVLNSTYYNRLDLYKIDLSKVNSTKFEYLLFKAINDPNGLIESHGELIKSHSVGER